MALEISIYGPFSIADENGENRAPLSARARAIVALLVMSPLHKRSRKWIQDKLWSTRQHQQGSGSLRQALSELRKALGPDKNVLISDRNSLALDPDLFVIDDALRGTDSELFEDIDVQDPQYAEWVRDQRLASKLPSHVLAEEVAHSNAPRLAVSLAGEWSDATVAMAHSLTGSLAIELRENGHIDVLFKDVGAAPTDDCDLGIELVLNSYPTHFYISSFLKAGLEKRVVWHRKSARVAQGDERGTTEALLSLALTIADRVRSELFQSQRRDTGSANSLAFLAQQQIFEFKKTSLIQADNLLSQAHDLHPRGSYLAWRAFVRATARFEFREDSFLDPFSDAELLSQARADEPESSVPYAFSAQHIYSTSGDMELSKYLIKRAVESNPGNVLAWGMYANAAMLSGEYDHAKGIAHYALKIAPNRFEAGFLNLLVCIAETACENYDKARHYGAIAGFLSPDLVPVKRYNLALSIVSQDASRLANHVEDLRRFEPDFKLENVLSDTYPMPTLRRIPIADKIASRLA